MRAGRRLRIDGASFGLRLDLLYIFMNMPLWNVIPMPVGRRQHSEQALGHH
jgi:hypothetical protein